jgi:hypothetical protein
MRIYGVDTEDTYLDYLNCTDEQFIDEAETHGLIWEDLHEFIRQLNDREINPKLIIFRAI